MILLIAFMTLFIGVLIEKKFAFMSKLIKTKFGTTMLSSNIMLFITIGVLAYVLMFVMAVLNMPSALLFILLGIMLGLLMLSVIVRDFMMKS